MKAVTVEAHTEKGSLFQTLITLLVKKYFVMSLENEFTLNFKSWPLVLQLVLFVRIADRELTILVRFFCYILSLTLELPWGHLRPRNRLQARRSGSKSHSC